MYWGRKSLFRHWKRLREHVPELGERHTLCNWVVDDPGPMVDFQRYGELLSLLPDKIVTNLERARLSRDGRVPMLKAGLGYEELLSSVIVDGTAVANSTTENILFPDLMIPANYLQPGGIPGRTLRWRARGRVSVVVTAVPTLTFNIGHGATAVTVPTTSWAKSGAIGTDAVAITNSQWFCEGEAVVRSVGASGTVFAQGYVLFPGDSASNSAAKKGNYFMGSAGAQTPATATVDMTVNEFLCFTAKWSAANASNTITGHIYCLEALN